MIAIAPLPGQARQEITHWPSYPPPYTALDYALRARRGWLDIYGSKRGCVRLGGYRRGKLVGFSLLVPDAHAPKRAEFFIAIHPGHLHKGFGSQLTWRTLEYGFHRHGFTEIHLKVRKDHKVGKHTYSKLGFFKTGKEPKEVTNGILTAFFAMSLPRKRFLDLEGRSGLTARPQTGRKVIGHGRSR